MRVLVLATLIGLTSCGFARALAGPFIETASIPNKITQPIRSDARLAVLWVGHATVLLQMEDRLILTDPVFTSAVGQLSKRTVEPGLEVSAVPHLDAVLISHLHFDHLSLGSLDLLSSKIGHLFLPRSGTQYLPDYPFPLTELGWGERWTRDDLTITGVPVRHNGWRYALDAPWMTKGFTGYVIEHAGLRVYFGGDTGYGPQFRKTRERFGPIDLAILPIAPMAPRVLMAPNHVDPAEALDAFRDLGARRMLAMHFDTIPNSTDAPGEAPRMLREEMAVRGLTDDDVVLLAHGEQKVILSR